MTNVLQSPTDHFCTSNSLVTHSASQELERLVLEIEHKYGLIADGRTIDPRTATILGIHSTRRSNGKESQEVLETATLEIATT